MKLVFQKNANGIELGFVECLSTKEADEFLSWFGGKLGNAPAPETTQTVEEAEVVNNAPVVAVEKKPTKNDVGQAAIALVQSKGRPALEPILKKYSAKRISEIGESDIANALADIRQAQGAV